MPPSSAARIPSSSAAARPRTAPARRRGMDAGPVQRLGDVDVAEAGDPPLIEQERLDRRAHAGERRRQRRRVERGQRIGTDARQRGRRRERPAGARPSRSGARRRSAARRRRRARTRRACGGRAARAPARRRSRPVMPRWISTPRLARRRRPGCTCRRRRTPAMASAHGDRAQAAQVDLARADAAAGRSTRPIRSRRPRRRGASPRTIVSTSGSSGIASPSPTARRASASASASRAKSATDSSSARCVPRCRCARQRRGDRRLAERRRQRPPQHLPPGRERLLDHRLEQRRVAHRRQRRGAATRRITDEVTAGARMERARAGRGTGCAPRRAATTATVAGHRCGCPAARRSAGPSRAGPSPPRARRAPARARVDEREHQRAGDLVGQVADDDQRAAGRARRGGEVEGQRVGGHAARRARRRRARRRARAACRDRARPRGSAAAAAPRAPAPPSASRGRRRSRPPRRRRSPRRPRRCAPSTRDRAGSSGPRTSSRRGRAAPAPAADRRRSRSGPGSKRQARDRPTGPARRARRARAELRSRGGDHRGVVGAALGRRDVEREAVLGAASASAARRPRFAATPPHTTSAAEPSRASARRDLRTSTSTTAAWKLAQKSFSSCPLGQRVAPREQRRDRGLEPREAEVEIVAPGQRARQARPRAGRRSPPACRSPRRPDSRGRAACRPCRTPRPRRRRASRRAAASAPGRRRESAPCARPTPAAPGADTAAAVAARRVSEEHGRQVAGQVVHADERLAERERQRLGRLDADQQRARPGRARR